MKELSATIFSGVCANMPLKYLDAKTLEEMAVVSVMAASIITRISELNSSALEKLMQEITHKYTGPKDREFGSITDGKLD